MDCFEWVSVVCKCFLFQFQFSYLSNWRCLLFCSSLWHTPYTRLGQCLGSLHSIDFSEWKIRSHRFFCANRFCFTVSRWTIEIQLQLQRKQFNLKFKITLSTVRSFKVKRSTDIYSACEIISRNLLWAVVIVEKSVRKLNCNVLTQLIAVYIRSSYKIAVQSWQENFLVFHRMSASLYRPRLVLILKCIIIIVIFCHWTDLVGCINGLNEIIIGNYLWKHGGKVCTTHTK